MKGHILIIFETVLQNPSENNLFEKTTLAQLIKTVYKKVA